MEWRCPNHTRGRGWRGTRYWICETEAMAEKINNIRVAESHFALHVMDATLISKRLSIREKIKS
jgi:hypothetical protein